MNLASAKEYTNAKLTGRLDERAEWQSNHKRMNSSIFEDNFLGRPNVSNDHYLKIN
jgi:hypothetical protein